MGLLVSASNAASIQGVRASSEGWQRALKDAVRDPIQLCRMLDLPPEIEVQAARAAREFPVFAPRGYIARMQAGDPHDPLLRQVLPLSEELTPAEGFVTDPVGDRDATLSPGLLHKYRNRALMVTTGACAVHCRYCFRRHYSYGESPRSPEEWRPAMDQIAQDEEIHEVILSGGDPLTMVDAHLSQLAAMLAQIPHVRRLRVHTRLPIMIPERVTAQLLGWLTGGRLTPIVVIHANHAAEIDESVAASIGRLVDAGVPVLNQAVLLRGVNDDVETLAQLCEALVDNRVMPYYLHQLDRVTGAAHFEVSVARGLKLIGELRNRLPGYAIPRYVREVAGAQSKTAIP